MRKYALVGLISLVLSAAWTQATLVTPWTETFDTDPTTNVDYIFRDYTDTAWTWTNSGLTASYVGTGGGDGFSFLGSVSDLGGAGRTNNFSMSVSFSVDTQYNQVALTALSSTNWTTGYQAFFRGKDAALVIRDGGTSASANVVVVSNAAFRASGDYVMTFAGSYNAGGGLDLTAMITDSSNNTITASWTDDSGLRYGQYFGVGGRVVPSADVTLDSFSVIPEPATMGLFGLCGAGVILFRRLLTK